MRPRVGNGKSTADRPPCGVVEVRIVGLHTALTAKRYAPILITGTIGGAVIEWISSSL
jgi:hypothetical protein